MDIEKLKELRTRLVNMPRFAPQVLGEHMFLAAPLVLPNDTVDEALDMSADLNTLRQDLLTALDEVLSEQAAPKLTPGDDGSYGWSSDEAHDG